MQHFPECHGAATGGGGEVPISHNALQHFPECHGAATGGGGGTLPGPAGGGGTLPGPGREGGTLPGPAVGGYPARSSRGGYPGGGVPDLGTPRGGTRWGGGYPGQDNIGSTCYTAGGMPLAFTQEDFLVGNDITIIIIVYQLFFLVVDRSLSLGTTTHYVG